jgi:hypothetical protein
MTSWESIVATVYIRQANQSDLLRSMIEVKRRYNGEWILPYVAEADDAQLPSTTPSLIAQGIDFIGRQAASVMPQMHSPVVDPSKETGVRSREFAAIRRKVLGATHHKSRTKLHLRRGYRHLAGYATTALVVVPDFDCAMPRLELRDPLTAYPEPRAAEDLRPPSNVAFVFAKSVDWLRRNFPACHSTIPAETLGTDTWDMVEWVDEDVIVLGILGPRDVERRELGAAGVLGASMELARWPNPTGLCPAYLPAAVTLDRIVSQMAMLTGQVDLMNRLQALAIASGEKAIFRDRYIVGDSINVPRLVGGQWKDGRTGEVNIVLDAKQIGELAGTPDPNTQMMIDRLERNARIDSGLVPQAGGETYGALRTGRGIDSLMGAAVDPRIQEVQEVMEVALEHINTVMLESYKAYWPQRTYTLFSGRQADDAIVEFVPERHVETTENVVSYTIPGADVQGTTIQLGQLLGMKAISLHTLRSRHPYIDDPDGEATRVEEEFLEQAVLEGIANQAASGQLPVAYLAKIEKHRKRSPDIMTALLAAEEELKAEQAAVAPEPEPGQFASPEQMPGMAPGQAPPVPPTAGQLPPGGIGPDAGLPPNAAPGEIGPQENQRGFRRLLEALSQRPPAT